MLDSKYEYIDCFNEEDRKRLSRMLMMSRAESGLSQEKVALELGIAKKTVQNWERGVSAPTLPQAIGWFRVMKVAAMPYFIQFMFPEIEVTRKKDDDASVRKKLLLLLETLPPEGIRQLLFLLYGDHGSSPRAVLNLITAHLQTPIKERYSNASSIVNDYKLAKDMDELNVANGAVPDTVLLDKALEQGRNAIVHNKTSYMIIETGK